MKPADLERARKELADPRERAIRDLNAFANSMLGIIFLGSDLENLVQLKKDGEQASQDLEAAKTQLLSLNDAIASAEIAEAEAVAAFEQTKRERELEIAALDAQARQLGGVAARVTKVTTQEQAVAEQRARLEELRTDLERREASLTAMRQEVLTAQSLQEQRMQLEQLRDDLERREETITVMHRTIMQSMKGTDHDDVKEPSGQPVRNG